MTDKELEVKRIVTLHGKDADRAYTDERLPIAENIIPLSRLPEQTILIEKISNTEYTLNAHFKDKGDDLLSLLCQMIFHGVAPNENK